MAVARRYVVTLAGRERLVEVEAGEAGPRVRVDGRPLDLDLLVAPDGEHSSAWVRVGARVLGVERGRLGPNPAVFVGGTPLPVEVVEEARHLLSRARGGTAAAAADGAVRAPMTGRVIRCAVRPGAAVRSGQPLLVIEAMKMENEIRAPRDGTVRAVAVEEGRPVDAGDLLVEIG